MPKPDSFESWDLTMPKVPARSRLYSLTPIGIGTSRVEGLTGYVVRLAEAHAVSVGDLVGRELSQHSPVPLPLIHPSHRLFPRRQRSHCFRAGSYSLNGLGETTAIWVKALEIGTCQSALQFLTLLPLAETLSEIWIFRKFRAWCPECYQTWRRQDLPLYEPLLWSFQAVTTCLCHHRPFQECCPHCHYRTSPLAIFSRPGYCAHCRQWLGLRAPQGCVPPGKSHRSLDDDRWIATALAGLLSAMPRLMTKTLKKAFQDNLRDLVHQLAGGNMAAFCRAVPISFHLFYGWIIGRNLPCLDHLLYLSKCLGILPVDLVTPGQFTTEPARQQLRESVRSHFSNCKPRRTYTQLRCVLQATLTETPPPDVTTVARRLGYRSASVFYRADAALAKQITKNHRASGRFNQKRRVRPICSTEKMKRALELALASDNPIPLQHLAQQLGYRDTTIMQKRFPDLCRAILEKRDPWNAQRVFHIRSVVSLALQEEPPPSLAEIARRLNIGMRKTLRKYCPNVGELLAERRAAYRAARLAHREAALLSALVETPPPSIRHVARRLKLSKNTLKRGFRSLCRAIGIRYRKSLGAGTIQRDEPTSCQTVSPPNTTFHNLDRLQSAAPSIPWEA
jgi:AraC-like DNA-binding protein